MPADLIIDMTIILEILGAILSLAAILWIARKMVKTINRS